MTATPKHPITSVTIVAVLIAFATMLKDRFGWDISESETEDVITTIVEFGSLLVAIWGRIRARQPVGFTSTPKAFLLLMPLLLVGCATGTELTSEQVDTKNLGHSAVRMDGDTIASTGLDTPTVIWSDAGQHTKASPFAETAMTLSLPNGLALHLTTPKDGDIDSLDVGFEDGQITSVKIEGIHYKASDILVAQAERLIPLVEYAQSLSEDELERFKAAVGVASPELWDAIKVLIGN